MVGAERYGTGNFPRYHSLTPVLGYEVVLFQWAYSACDHSPCGDSLDRRRRSIMRTPTASPSRSESRFFRITLQIVNH